MAGMKANIKAKESKLTEEGKRMTKWQTNKLE